MVLIVWAKLGDILIGCVFRGLVNWVWGSEGCPFKHRALASQVHYCQLIMNYFQSEKSTVWLDIRHGDRKEDNKYDKIVKENIEAVILELLPINKFIRTYFAKKPIPINLNLRLAFHFVKNN